MKTLKTKCLLASLLFLFFSCQKDKSIKNNDSDKEYSEVTIQEIHKALVTLGFPVTDVRVNGDSIFVEDMILYKSFLFPNDKSSIPRQATNTANPRLFKSGTITVYFPPMDRFAWGFTDTEVRRMTVGFNRYLKSNLNNGGGIDRFIFTRNPTFGYDLIVNLASFGNSSNVCANASLATTRRSGNEIGVTLGGTMNVNVNYLRGLKGKFRLTDAQLTFLIAHEFGHNIGLRHTNWQSEVPVGSVGYYTIPGTGSTTSPTNPDPYSVLNGGTCGWSWSDFTELDKLSIKYITNVAPTN